MAGAIPTNSARTQSESVAGLAVASDGGRDGFRRQRHRQAAVLFSAVVHRRRPRDRACCPCRVGRTLLKMRGHPTPANISTLAADRRNGRLQLKSLPRPSRPFIGRNLKGSKGSTVRIAGTTPRLRCTSRGCSKPIRSSRRDGEQVTAATPRLSSDRAPGDDGARGEQRLPAAR
jgi:hypothetical protein